ncbi:hypothetical protein B0H14DRAFT_3162823 [Mycena olivaceomarginata]|nr:hypothetical protein B0H14DRAFT_3162823 [Mycena olivaceomarginata]
MASYFGRSPVKYRKVSPAKSKGRSKLKLGVTSYFIHSRFKGVKAHAAYLLPRYRTPSRVAASNRMPALAYRAALEFFSSEPFARNRSTSRLGKSLNFKVFSKKSSLLGAIGDSEGAQAQGLGDVIILRQMNTPHVNGVPTVTAVSILLFIWKTCLVHFKRGVFKLEAHVDDYVFNCLLGFPYLETSEEIAAYRDFCQASTNPKDLTPGDTNPIEGSHLQDNQVNHTNLTILEAVLIVQARAYDQETARIITASKALGVMENGNNPHMARFSAQARRQARSRVKAMEKANADGGKELRGKLLKSQQQIATRDAEIKCLQAEVDALQERRRAPSQLFIVHSPPSSPLPIPKTRGSANSNYQAPSHVNDSPIAGPSRLPELDLISRRRKLRAREPSSDFNYEAALKSDVLDTTLHRIAYGTSDIDVLMYPVGDPDDGILASDSYTPS